MTNGNNLPNELPPIKRCRDYHLYDYKGNRYLDLYLDGGRALMGHKPGKVMLPLKNSLEKGIWALYPSVYSGRLKKILSKLFPSYEQQTFFANAERAQNALGVEKYAQSIEWIPFTVGKGERLIVRPLIPGIDQTVIILSHEEIPSGDLISPVLLEGMIRSFHDYELFQERKDFSLWDEFDNLEKWERSGPCLSYKGTEEDYKRISEQALEKKILIPCKKEQPLFIPIQLSLYEKQILIELLTSKGEETP
jgi:hypothetical protein